MIASRAVLRSTRAVRVNSTRPLRNVRFQSTNPQPASNGTSPALIGGIAGGALVFGAGYMWYHFSGVKTAVNTAHQAKSYFDSATNQLKMQFKDKTPEPNEALQWLRQTATSYAAFIPGAKAYVDSAFDDLDAVRNKHGDEVDQIVKEAYGELRDVSKDGINLSTAQKVWEVLQKHLSRLGDLAGDAASDILNNHPELKKRVGGNLDQLKELGDKYGPEAKKQVDETWSQIRDIMKSGLSADTPNKIRKLVDDKMEVVRKMGDEAWKKGMEQAQPYLEKNPKIKQLVEQNADALKQGNVQELYSKVKDAVSSGNMEGIEQYVKSATDKAKQMGAGGVEQWLKMIPGGGEILPKLSQLRDVADKHGKEAEKLLRDTMDELKGVLEKRSGQASELAEKAEKSAK